MDKTHLLRYFLIALMISTVAAAEDSDPAIEYLLDYVRQSDAVFIRNGKAHTPAEAAAHVTYRPGKRILA